jgi:hypothetical protein
MAEASKKLLLQDIEEIPDDHPSVKKLEAEKGRLAKLTPEQRSKELKQRVDTTVKEAVRNESEMRALQKSGQPESVRLKMDLLKEQAEMQFAFGTIAQFANIFGDKYQALYAQRMMELFGTVWAMEAGKGVGAAAIPGGQYIAVGLAVISLIQVAEEMQKGDRDPVMEGISLILSEIKSLKEQIADLGRHLDTKLDIYFGALFDQLTSIELQLGSIQQNLIDLRTQVAALSDQVSRGFREIKDRALRRLTLKCFDDRSIVRKAVVTEQDATECMKTFATNMIHPDQAVPKGFPALREDVFWPFSENAEVFRLWLIDFAKRQHLQNIEKDLSTLGTIPSAAFWASNADALSTLVEQHPWIASATLSKGVVGSGAEIGRRMIGVYDALGSRRSRRAGITLGEDILLALMRASAAKQTEVLSSIEKNPWSVTAGRLNPRGDFDQKVAHMPEFAKAPLPTCDKIPGTEGFEVDAPALTWHDVVPESFYHGRAWSTLDPGTKDFYFNDRHFPQPVKAAIANAFKSQRLSIPGGVDKKLTTWAVNADIVKPASLVACLSRVSLSGYSILMSSQYWADYGVSFDFSVKIDVWLTWDGRENPAAEPKPMAALASRQELRDRAGLQWSCLWEFPRAESWPELLLNGEWSFAVPNHSGTLRLCSRNGPLKDAWAKVATETLSDIQNKQGREQAKVWISAKLNKERADALERAQINSKPQLEETREIRFAFSALIQLGFWPELISDTAFRDAVEQAAQDLDVDRNLADTLAGSSSQAVQGRIDSDIMKLQQWMSDQSRDYALPRQTRILQQTIDRLDRAQALLSATTQY